MSLKGTLRDFPVADILQLIGSQKKTGALILSSGTDITRIFFRAGMVIGAERVPPLNSEQLLKRLRRAALVSEAVEARLLKLNKETGMDVAEMIRQDQLIDPELVKKFWTADALELVFRIFFLTDGFYEFQPQTVLNPFHEISAMPAEHVIMEGAQRVDEWPQVQARIRSSRLKLRRLRELPDIHPPSAGGDEIDRALRAFEQNQAREFSTSLPLTEAERRVFSIVDRSLTVADLIHRSLLGEFETCRAIVQLLDKKLVGPVRETQTAAKELPIDNAPRLNGWRRLMTAGLEVTIVLLGLIGVAAIGHRYPSPVIPVDSHRPFGITNPLLDFKFREQFGAVDHR